MRGRILVPAALAVALVVPSAALATDYTVDPGVGAGCTAIDTNGKSSCRSITDAVTKVNQNVSGGDSITINDGTYTEPGTINVTSPHVLITAKNVLKVTVTQNSTTVDANSKPPVFTLVEGDQLNGLVIKSPTDGGPAVQVKGANTTVSYCLLSKEGISTRDTPVYEVQDAVIHGVNNVNHSSVLSAPTASATQTSPTITSSQFSTLSLDSVVVFAGQQQGPAVLIAGADKTDDGLAIPNRIRDSLLGAVNPNSSALVVESHNSGPPANLPIRTTALEIDSTILNGGATTGASLVAHSFTAGPGADNAGDISITAIHTTTAGSEFPFVVQAASSGSTAAKGNVSITFDRSIVHGTGQGTVETAPAQGGILGLIGTTKANTASVNIRASDTTQVASPAVTLTGTQKSLDADLFVDAPHLNFHLVGGSPAIDKGGPIGQGESTLDVDGDNRLSGPATDLGADEFTNHPPIAVGAVNITTAKQGQDILYSALGSHDPDGGPIAKYIWVWGDGTSSETTSPVTTHHFILLGDYYGSVQAVDPQGLASVAFQLPHIRVTDGSPPQVKITAPKAGKTLKLFTIKTSKSKKTGKKVTTKKLNTIKLTGTAIDEAGVANADLSLRRLNLTGKKPDLKNCITTDGKHSFKTTSCKNPVFFRVAFKNGAFSYTLKESQRLKPGTYELSARATDKNGNVSAPVSVQFKLK